MRSFRSVWRSVLLVGLLVAACADGKWRKLFCGLKPGPAGAVWVHGWCRRILRALGLPCEVMGPLPKVTGANGLAVVSNHLSYLDILMYCAQTPFVMVAKTEVRGWPLLGWLTTQAGTVYVQRADVKGGQTQTHAEVNAMMAEAYRSGLPVMFYPEGTTTDGETILPFRRGLFHSVLHDRVPVRAASIRYSLEGGNGKATVGQEVCYWGDMEFVPHLFRCLGLRGLSAVVAFSAEEVCGEDRFALALNSRERVSELYRESAGVLAQAARARELGDASRAEEELPAVS